MTRSTPERQGNILVGFVAVPFTVFAATSPATSEPYSAPYNATLK